MTREIKFKWVARNKKFNTVEISEAMTTHDLLTDKYPSWMSLGNRRPEGNCEFIAEIQFVGLNDKNGKEIFEGDIIEWDEPTKGINSRTRALVEWLNNCALFGVRNEWMTDMLCNTLPPWEVIGNIWQSPELLEVKR